MEEKKKRKVGIEKEVKVGKRGKVERRKMRKIVIRNKRKRKSKSERDVCVCVCVCVRGW